MPERYRSRALQVSTQRGERLFVEIPRHAEKSLGLRDGQRVTVTIEVD